MNKSEKEIINQFPNATDRKRVRDYNSNEYFGIDLPDNPEFGERTKKDAWIIVLINVIFFAGIILTAAFILKCQS